MTLSDTMTLALLVTGSLSLYVILHAAVDVLRNARSRRDP